MANSGRIERQTMTEPMETIYCEQRRCPISVTGCVSRQKRATFGTLWQRGYGPGNNGGRQVPFDPVCKDCQQGKEVMNMIDGQKYGAVKPGDPVFPERVELVKNEPKAEGQQPTEAEFHERLVAECFVKAPEGEHPETEKPESAEEIPYGYCHCGCGQKTKISDKTCNAWGHVQGEPRKWLQGHATRKRKPGDTEKRATKPKKPGKKPVNKQAGATDMSYPPVENYKDVETVAYRKFIIDFGALNDSDELRAVLEKRAAENLRTIDAQATWEVVQVMRSLMESKTLVAQKKLSFVSKEKMD
jgi:hypothetical protein